MVDTDVLDGDMAAMEDDWPATITYEGSDPMSCIVGPIVDSDFPVEGGLEGGANVQVSVRKSVADGESVTFQSMHLCEINGDGIPRRIQSATLSPDNVEWILLLVEEGR